MGGTAMHGFKWIGDSDRLAEYAGRTPGGVSFLECDLPPVEPRNWLQRPPVQCAGSWSSPEAAAGWLADLYQEYPAAGEWDAYRVGNGVSRGDTGPRPLNLPIDLLPNIRRERALRELREGRDFQSGYWTNGRRIFVSVSVLICHVEPVLCDFCCAVRVAVTAETDHIEFDLTTRTVIQSEPGAWL
jgi:hypothetical protein